MANLRLASDVQFDSIVDGPGVRIVIWTQGCPHHCMNCHNPHTHDEKGGKEYAIQDIIEQIQTAQLQTGLTLSGGEPFMQSVELLPVVEAAKAKKLNIWAYSGFTFEELIKHDAQRALLEKIDVLVDGKFIDEQRDYRLVFKGSKNQRIIDVQKSLVEHHIVFSSYDAKNKDII